MIDAFGEHAGKEERVVSDVLAHLALAVKGRSWAKHRVGFHQHFANIGKRLPGRPADLVELLYVTEFREQMCDVTHDLRIADSDFLGVVPTDEFNEKFLQRMRFWNHPGLL